MNAWSERTYFVADLSDLSYVTGSFTVSLTNERGRLPLAATGLRVVVAGSDGFFHRRHEAADDGEVAGPTDGELMARVTAGDDQAFATVFDRYGRTLFGTVMQFLRDPGAAEDVVQETYLTMWTRSESYSPEAGSLIGWLLTIARHRAIDRLRAQSRQPLVVGPGPASDGAESDLERLFALGQPIAFSAGADEPADLAERRWVGAVVRAAMEQMPEPERRALELAYDDGLTQLEIAERLGWPIGTVKTRTRRALLRLRARLESVPDIGPSPSGLPSRGNRIKAEEVRHGPR